MVFVLKHKPANCGARWKTVKVDAEDSEAARSQLIEELSSSDSLIRSKIDHGEYLIKFDWILTNAARF